MAEHWQTLIANFAVVALVISTWVHAGKYVVRGRSKLERNLVFGVAMGLGAVASIVLAIPIDGAYFDLRSSLLVIAGFFGGFPAAFAAVVITLAYRVLLGGPTVPTAAVGMVLAAGTGMLISAVLGRSYPGPMRIAVVALAAGASSLGLTLVLSLLRGSTVTPLSVQIAFMNVLATALSAFFIMRHRGIERERDLLRAAFAESPDYQYVKTAALTFANVNNALARHHGVPTPAALAGKTDFDLETEGRARDLMLAEQKVLETGKPLENIEELVHEPDGDTWYLTTKVPLHDRDGEIIGLAGVTRDITLRKKLREELTDSRNQMTYVLREITDGIAMFDKNEVLVYCNEQYRKFFELTAAARVPGASIREILGAVAATGEQRGIPPGGEAEWIEQVAATLHNADEQEVQLFDGRWLHVRSRPTSDGSSLVVVSEVTRIKQAESALRTMTEQLKLLATTDGLTGLTNRRAFDQALEVELARSRRGNEPLALLLIDVDRFKSYNDIYGHQAGDEVLKTVAMCLKGALKRPTDVGARYGGEEFVAILPRTDEDGAFFIADAFRESLKACAVPHKGGDKGVLTASVGIAVFGEADGGMNATELIRRADEALYNAKGAGRDRVTGWRPRHEIRPVGRAQG